MKKGSRNMVVAPSMGGVEQLESRCLFSGTGTLIYEYPADITYGDVKRDWLADPETSNGDLDPEFIQNLPIYLWDLPSHSNVHMEAELITGPLYGILGEISYLEANIDTSSIPAPFVPEYGGWPSGTVTHAALDLEVDLTVGGGYWVLQSMKIWVDWDEDPAARSMDTGATGRADLVAHKGTAGRIELDAPTFARASEVFSATRIAFGSADDSESLLKTAGAKASEDVTYQPPKVVDVLAVRVPD